MSRAPGDIDSRLSRAIVAQVFVPESSLQFRGAPVSTQWPGVDLIPDRSAQVRSLIRRCTLYTLYAFRRHKTTLSTLALYSTPRFCTLRGRHVENELIYGDTSDVMASTLYTIFFVQRHYDYDRGNAILFVLTLKRGRQGPRIAQYSGPRFKWKTAKYEIHLA